MENVTIPPATRNIEGAERTMEMSVDHDWDLLVLGRTQPEIPAHIIPTEQKEAIRPIVPAPEINPLKPYAHNPMNYRC